MNRQDNSAFASTSPTLRQLNPIDGSKDGKGELNVGRSPVLLPPGDTNVSFEQFADSLLCSWPVTNQTGSIFWTLGIPTQMMAIDVSHDGPIFRTTPISIIIFHTFFFSPNHRRILIFSCYFCFSLSRVNGLYQN